MKINLSACPLMKIPLMLLINGCKNGQDVVEDSSSVASLLLHVKKRNEAKAESTISYLVHTHVFVLQALDSSSTEFFYTTFLSINFNNMTRGKMIHLKPIHYDRWRKT